MLGPMYAPAHPGALVRETIEGLSEETGQPQTLTHLARALGMTRKTLSALVNERHRVTPEIALRLAAGFRNTSADFWMRVQQDYDLAQARKQVSTDQIPVLWPIKPGPLPAPAPKR